MKKSALNIQRNIIWPIILLLLVGVVLIILDRERILRVITQADWQYIPAILFFIFCSYGLVSYSYAILAHLMGIQMSWKELSATYFVTAVMNRVVRSGGAAGFSVRYMIMKQYGVSLNDVLSSSFIHFLLGSLIMLGMLPVGSLYMSLTGSLVSGVAGLLTFMTLISILFGLGAVAILFSGWLRDRVVKIAARLTRKVIHRDITPALDGLNQRITAGVQVLHQAPLHSGEVILLLFAEWWANVVVLGFCLKAFGASLPIGAVAVLFVFGIMAGVITALPGGLGVQEGVMTIMALAQGATFEQGILAAMLFRVVHSIIPYLVSPVFYVRLLHAPRSGAMV